jgi:hypothetical protein
MTNLPGGSPGDKLAGPSEKRCQVPKELPPELLALVRKLDAGEDNLLADNPSKS